MGHGKHANFFCTTEKDVGKMTPDLDHLVSTIVVIMDKPRDKPIMSCADRFWKFFSFTNQDNIVG